ncbi:MAG: hypothetical protein NXI15_04020 [Gammaproteobacteria bacterium]|jgi:hypothetical protein|nr:hypothetical protein [Gammaproteobacteria bacterium]
MDKAQLIFCICVGVAFIAMGAVVAMQSPAGVPVMIVGGGVLAAAAFTVWVNRQTDKSSMVPARVE